MCMPRRRCVQVEKVFAAITMQKFVRRFLARKAFRARLRIWGMGQAAKVRPPSPGGHFRLLPHHTLARRLPGCPDHLFVVLPAIATGRSCARTT